MWDRYKRPHISSISFFHGQTKCILNGILQSINEKKTGPNMKNTFVVYWKKTEFVFNINIDTRNRKKININPGYE